MLSSSQIVAIVSTAEPAKAKTFYRDVLKVRLVSDEPFALVFDANGTMLRIAKVNELTVAPYTVLGWRVVDIEATVRRLIAAGVAFERYQGLAQDEFGVWTSPDGAKVVWFKDPDGNTLSLTQFPR